MKRFGPRLILQKVSPVSPVSNFSIIRKQPEMCIAMYIVGPTESTVEVTHQTLKNINHISIKILQLKSHSISLLWIVLVIPDLYPILNNQVNISRKEEPVLCAVWYELFAELIAGGPIRIHVGKGLL